MHTTKMKNASALALLTALACMPVSQAYGQSANASDRGQTMGQGTLAVLTQMLAQVATLAAARAAATPSAATQTRVAP